MHVVFVSSNGKERCLQARDEASVMELAVAHDVEGIVAECRGSCTCATCHVLIDPDWLSRIPPAAEMEDDMLEALPERSARSRLSCQLRLAHIPDGLRVEVPASQY